MIGDIVAKLTEEKLKAALATGEFLPVYCLYGSETYLITHYASGLAEKSVGNCMPDFNLTRFEGANSTLSQILEAAEALPVMHSHRCILVRDFLATDSTDDELAALEEYVANPSPQTVLVFYFTGVQPAATGKWKPFMNAMKKAEGDLKFSPKTQQDLVRIVVSGAGKRGCRMSAGTAGYLIECVGSDLNTLLCEVEKLCAFRMNQEITTKDVDKLSPKALSVSAFQMLREISAGNGKSALKTLENLFANREEPIKILGALSASYVKIYQALTAQEEGIPLERLAETLGVKNPSSLQYSLKDARKLGGVKIDRSLQLLCRQDEKLKSLPVDEKIILQETVVSLLEIAKG